MLMKEYGSTEQELALLRGSENQMQVVDKEVAFRSSEIRQQQELLSRSERDDAYLMKRIHRNENPRFFHYFVLHRGAKVERLKEEHEEVVAREKDISDKLAANSANLSQLQRQQQNAHATVDRKHQMEARLRSLFDQVVDTSAPTSTLHQLQVNAQAQRQVLATEQGLLQAIGNSAQGVQQGICSFQHAQGLYRQAFAINLRAQQTVTAEMYEGRRERRDEMFGDDFGARNAEWQRENFERQERMLQAQRDSIVNQANHAAMQGYQAVSRAFSTFPMEARSRYPQQCAGIGQVAFPRIEGANFTDAFLADAIFGTLGARVNDFSSGCKIQHNMGVVEQCVSMTSHQLGLVTAMQGAVQANVQQCQSSLQDIEMNISKERTNIFNAARAACGGA